jgi:hypothetical protein
VRRDVLRRASWTVTLGLVLPWLVGCEAIRANSRPLCGDLHPMVLSAEAVPTAPMVPCVRVLPAGWHFAGFVAGSGRVTFWLRSDLAGKRALEVSLAPSCATGGARRIGSDERGTTRFETTRKAGSVEETEWMYRIGRSCTTYRFLLPSGQADRLRRQIESGLTFEARGAIAASYRRATGQPLETGVRAGT